MKVEEDVVILVASGIEFVPPMATEEKCWAPDPVEKLFVQELSESKLSR